VGDLVLVQDQVSSVMTAALDNGLEVAALHNHFIWDSPRIMFVGSDRPSSLTHEISCEPATGY
jgi:hypothetical protein